MKLIAVTLTGFRRELELEDETISGLQILKNLNKYFPVENHNFIINGKVIWEILDEKFSGELKVNVLMELGTFPAALLKHRMKRQEYKIQIVKDQINPMLGSILILNIDKLCDHVKEQFREATNNTVNKTDPIPLDSEGYWFYWSDNGKNFKMDYYNMIEYSKPFIETGSQIPNPYTNNPITSPWREQIIFMCHK